jgi:hypothetical protein
MLEKKFPEINLAIFADAQKRRVKQIQLNQELDTFLQIWTCVDG